MKRKRLMLITLTALLSACSAFSPSDPLQGTTWTLSAIGERSPVAGTTVTLEFKDGQASGTAGCNGYGGSYEVDGDKISFHELASTLMLCTGPEGIMEQEAEFLGSLNEAGRFELAGGRLQLFRSDGEALTFIPVP